MADPMLLSLLQKVSAPPRTIKLSAHVKGIFAFPQQWVNWRKAKYILDKYHHSLVSYTKKLSVQLTQKQIKEAEEAKAKKGSKKDSKVEEPPHPHTTPEEEAEALRKQRQWEALSPQQKFHIKSEDPFQSPILKFEKTEFARDIAAEADIDKLQAQLDREFIEVIVVRKPDISQEEIAKLKKAKPKGLNLAELTKFTFKGQLRLRSLLKPGTQKQLSRVKLTQVDQGLPADAPRFEMKDCYIHIQVEVSPALVPLVTEVRPSTSQLFKMQAAPDRNTLDGLIGKLKGEIVVAMKSISADYANLFAKDKEYIDDKKQSQTTYPQLRIAQANKKKDFFLNEFKNNGKYTQLRARLDRILKAIAIDKFRKERGLSKPSPQSIQKTLGQLQVFFNEQINSVVNDFITRHPEEIHEDLVMSHKISKESKAQIIAPIVSESQQQRYIRIAVEYQIINRIDLAEANLQNLVLLKPKNQGYLFLYVNFALRHGFFELAETLVESLIALNSSNNQYGLILAVLLLRRGRYKQAYSILQELLKQPDSKLNLQEKILYHQLSTMTLEKAGDVKQAETHKVMAEKLFKLKLNLPVKFDEQEDPFQQPRPKIPKPSKKASLLTPEQTEELNSSLIQTLIDLNAFKCLETELAKVPPSGKKTLWLAQEAISKKQYNQALKHLEQLLQTNNKNYDWMLMKADVCFLSERLFESEEIFLKTIKLKPNAPKTFALYLRLGNIYLLRKAWEDAKNIFLKACEIKPNSSLSWFGLGRANLSLGEYLKAEQAFCLTNIYEPFNEEVEKYLEQVRDHRNKVLNP